MANVIVAEADRVRTEDFERNEDSQIAAENDECVHNPEGQTEVANCRNEIVDPNQ